MRNPKPGFGNQLKLPSAILLACWLALLAALSVNAQVVITVTPSQLIITAPRGSLVTRQITVRSTEAVSQIQIATLDLIRTDNAVVLPASAIRAALPADQLPANGTIAIPVTVDLHDVNSGQYSGEMVLIYQNGSITIPVTITVKDDWPLPLAVLVAGIVFGVIVSSYRSRGKPRDTVILRAGQVQAQMRADAELARPFRARIEAHLVDVDTALQAENWEAAQQALARAEAVLAKWRRGRVDWLAQLAHGASMIQHLLDSETSSAYLQAVNRSLEDAVRQSPDLESPDKLREQLEAAAAQINRYAQLNTTLQQLEALFARIPAKQVKEWQAKVLSWRRQLETLAPTDAATYTTLQSEVEKALVDLTNLASQGRAGTDVKGLQPISGVPTLIPVGSPPSIGPFAVHERATRWAQLRLNWFTWISFAFAIFLLAGAGFNELYVSRATFGANFWSDYLALLAWGFGAEASRAAILELVRGWDVLGSQ